MEKLDNKPWRWAKNIEECLGKKVATHGKTYLCVDYEGDKLKCVNESGVWSITWFLVRISDVQP